LPDHKHYSEEQLVSLLQQRDQQAFSYLYDHYAGALNGIISRMVDQPQLAEDILQDAFIKIWNNFSQYDASKGRLFTWMINLTRNLAIDTLRSKGYKNQQKISTDENSVSNYQDKSHLPEKFDVIGLRKQLTHLKPDHRNLIDLAYFSGFTQDEIAKQLGIPLGTVKTRMRAAIMELRKMFEFK
jgi:RNA polymerase sigma-70 factor, ECF subfamily